MPRTPLACTEHDHVIAVRVHPGDTLSRIIQRTYPGQASDREAIIAQILADNPDITNRDVIHPGQLILLRVPFQRVDPGSAFLSDYRGAQREWAQMSPSERELAEAAAPVVNDPWSWTRNAMSLANGLTTSASDLVGSNIGHLENVVGIQNQYRSGAISRSARDGGRVQTLNQFDRNLGPTRSLVMGSTPTRQTFRAASGRSPNPDASMVRQIQGLRRVTSLIRGGGYVLTVVDAPLACREMRQTNDRQQQSRIAVGTAGGMAGGVGSGIVVGLLVSNPIGWKVAIAIGVGSVVGGWLSQRGAEQAYDKWGHGYDVVEVLRLEGICTVGE